MFHVDLIENTDITFVVDTSGSIGITNFQYVREFIEDIVLEMNIAVNNSRVAVILFAGTANLYFNLNQFTDKNSLIASINNLPYSGGSTDIPEALNLLRATALSGALGIRSNNRQIAIFLTDGEETNNIMPSATALAATNIFQVYSVGVDRARVDQLNVIALGNSEFVYYHSNFNERSLVVIAERMIEKLKGMFSYNHVILCKQLHTYIRTYVCCYVAIYIIIVITIFIYTQLYLRS